MAKVCVDRNKCQGLGVCESLAPEIFEIADDGALSLIDEGAFEERDRHLVISAVNGCPNEALRIAED